MCQQYVLNFLPPDTRAHDHVSTENAAQPILSDSQPGPDKIMAISGLTSSNPDLDSEIRLSSFISFFNT